MESLNMSAQCWEGTHFSSGTRFFRSGDYDSAIAHFSKAIAEEKNLYFLFENLAWCHELKGNLAEATAFYQQALALNDRAVRANYFFEKIKKENDEKKRKETQELQAAEKSVDLLKRKLLNLGFEVSAIKALDEISKGKNRVKALLASRVLSLFFLNKDTTDDAITALNYIDICLGIEKGQELLRCYSIMKAEALAKLDRVKEASKVISNAERLYGNSTDLILAKANLSTKLSFKLSLINKIYLEKGHSPVDIVTSAGTEIYTGLRTKKLTSFKQESFSDDSPLVTVIVPTYNAEATIGVALSSLLEQTWRKLEIIVVDDCSTDSTASVVKGFIAKDNRIKLIKAPKNAGPYVARNIALDNATGEFITCNDADDWSHAEKIATQVMHLMDNPDVLGNTSRQARATPDMQFHRRGNPGYYLFTNMSSFMFRREIVLSKLGYWDSVRFGADSEFIRRIKKAFGNDVLVDLETVPFSFQRQSADSLTGSEVFGYHGFFMGARKEHFESYVEFHQRNETTFYPFPMTERPFQVPEPMWPSRAEKDEQKFRHFDVIIISDFRLDGGSTISNIEEIKAQQAAGLRTGLVQMSRYDYQPTKKINPKVRELLDGNKVQFVVYGENVTCDHLIVRYPPVLQHQQKYIPTINPKKVSVIVNQPPMSDYGANAELRYEIPVANEYIRALTGVEPTWYPIGPVVRDALHKHHAQDLPSINLAAEDWTNIIDIEDWYRGEYVPGDQVITIGRHSRDNHHKWPTSKQQLLAAYPESPDIKVRVMGGAETVSKVVGYIPANWEVLPFGSMHPKEFLKDLDVFVYFTNEDWVESFGRVILEAMAVGVPVILPHLYRSLFGSAAQYAFEQEVESVVCALLTNKQLYAESSKRALDYVRSNFSYECHLKRLKD
jgi:glycosyltransferase involved in cell wall biosynthesis